MPKARIYTAEGQPKARIGAFARSVRATYEVDLSTTESQRFFKAVAVRDRITHPKNADSWTMTKDDVALVVGAWEWFGRELNAVGVAALGSRHV